MDGEERDLGRAPKRNLRIGIEEIASPSTARMLNRQNRRMLIIHADVAHLSDVIAGTDGFFPKLVDLAQKRGVQTRVVRARSKVAELMADPALEHMHITFGDMPGYYADTLHVGTGPVKGFWFLDEIGVGWNSSLRFAQFAPERLDSDAATYFFNGVSGWMLDNNVSPIAQPARHPGGLQKARAVLFCQEIEHHTPRAHFLTTEQMLRTMAEHDPAKTLYVKPHPNQSKPMRRDIMVVAQDYPNVIVTDASVHDLIAASQTVVTQNSGAGFEALMHKKPVITCAKSAYWHASLTAKTCEDLAEAMDFGPEAMSDFPFEKYFYWFLNRHLLEEAKDNFAERAWSKVVDKAFL